MNKTKVATVLVIPIYTSLYLLLAIFPIISMHVVFLNPFFNFSIYIFFTFYVMLLATFILRKKLQIKLEKPDWVKLNLMFLLVEIGVAVILIVFTAIFFVMFADQQNVVIWYMVWFLAFVMGIFPYFNHIRNTLGMKFGRIYGASVIGAGAYADLSAFLFRKNEESGFVYLAASLRMLRDYLQIGNRKLNLLQETISEVKTIRLYAKDIPYKDLTILAEKLSKLPEINEIGPALKEFHNAENNRWSLDFKPIKKRKWWNIERLGEKIMIPIALLIVTLIGAFPEQLRTQAITWITQIDWLGVIGFLIIAIIIYGIISFVQRLADVDISYSDFKEYMAFSAKE